MVRSLKLFLLAVLAFAMTGCAPPNVAMISTSADPSFRFDAPAQLAVRVVPIRDAAIDMDIEPTLDEKVLVDEVETGLSVAGFQVVRPGADRAADLVFFCEARSFEEVYDSYDRIPTTDTVVGTYRTRRGYRTYYETVHSSVIVPTRRWYRYTRLFLTAVEADAIDEAVAAERPVDRAGVWGALVEANGPLVMRDITWQTAEALYFWGQTADVRLKYPSDR